MKHELTSDTAARFAEIALGHVGREYPHKLDHVMDGPEDVLGPRALHPIFFGSFDWHSCVHGYWLLLTVRRLYPDLPVCRRIEALADEMLAPGKVAGVNRLRGSPAARSARKASNQARNSARPSTRLMHNASTRAEDRKSSPPGSQPGQPLSAP